MNIGELVALLRLDDSEFNSRVDEAGSRFESTAGRMTSAGKTMTANVTAPLVGLGTMAVMAGANFQTSMLKVQAVSGATGAEFDQLSALAKEMGSTTQFSASESADALGFLAMAGFDTNEMMSALPGVLNLAAAGSLDLASAADIASNVLSGYGLEVDQLGRVNDVMAKTASSANVDIAMMGETMKYAAPVAAAAGVEFEETAAMAGLMGNAGIQASQAGTALRGGLSRLLNPTKAVSSTLSALGVNVTDSNGALLPMVDIMGQLEGAGAVDRGHDEDFRGRSRSGVYGCDVAGIGDTGNVHRGAAERGRHGRRDGRDHELRRAGLLERPEVRTRRFAYRHC